MTDRGTIRFDGFELDPRARSLKRDGVAVDIKPKTFDLLLYLAEHPHKVVSKDELMAAVWPNSFVEERNLSQHVFLLRKALAAGGAQGDAVVTTVPGKGYQFTAALELAGLNTAGLNTAGMDPAGMDPAGMDPAGMDPAPRLVGTEGDSDGAVAIHAADTVTRLVVEDEQVGNELDEDSLAGAKPPRTEPSAARTLAAGRRKAVLLWAAATAAALVLAAAGWLGWARLYPKPGSHVQVVIADFENSTGDATFDHTLNKVVQIDLQQSPYFTVIGEGRLRHALGLMGRKPGAPITGEDVREACQRLNAQVYLTPAIAQIGSRYVVTMSANACADGATVGARKQEADAKNGVLRAVEEATSGIRRDVGESRASLKQFDKFLYLEKTSSLDALKAYSEATRQLNAGKEDDAARLFEHAIELDPEFAIAYADLSSMYFNMGDKAKDRVNIDKAYAMRDTVSERERYYIVFRYHQSVTGDVHAMKETLQLWSATYPQDTIVMDDLANYLTWIGQYPESADRAARAVELNEANSIYNGIAYEIEARAFKHLGNFDKAMEIYATTVSRKVDSPAIHGIALQVATLRHDQKGVDAQIAWARGTTSEAQILQQAGMAALADGHARESERWFAQATAAARRDHLEADMATIDAYRTRILAEVGLTARARELAEAFTAEDTYMDRLYTIAMLGDAGRARSTALEQQRQSPQDTLLNAEYVPCVLAALDVRAGKPADAVERLKGAELYELRDPTVSYQRGQAFLATGQPVEAEAQFRLLIAHPGIDDPLTPLHALAHLRLAQALAAQNKPADARAELGQFLEMWKTADPDLPPLKEAWDQMPKLAAKP